MPRYLTRVSHSPEWYSGVVNNPQNRGEAARILFEAVGAKVEAVYYVVGEDEEIVISEAPDEVSLEAIAIAVQASGFVKLIKTSVILTAEEVVEAMRRAGTVAYQPPRAVRGIKD